VDIAAVVTAAARLMRAQLATRGGQHWVYGRAGRPCRRCGTRIESARTGSTARIAYWCPHCQPPG
jgi:formamidopyrimidine-DNA glycosylase